MAYTTIDDPEAYFQTVLWTGNGVSGRAITLDGSTNLQPDLLWIKGRTTTRNYYLCDSVRGSTKKLQTDTTAAENTDTSGVTSFNSDGFSMGSDTDGEINDNTTTHVAWCWKESATAGFDIVTYSGSGATNISHNLSAIPKFMIVKRYSATESWFAYNGGLGQAKVGYLNDSVAWGSGTNVWGGSDPTSSVFSIGSDSGISGSGDYVAYLFADIQGYQKSGIYEGSGSTTDNTFVYLGFKPAMIIVKAVDTANQWNVFDNKRNTGNPMDKRLFADSTDTETTYASFDFLSNGFKVRNTSVGIGTADTFMYYAVAEAPLVNSNGVPCTAR